MFDHVPAIVPQQSPIVIGSVTIHQDSEGRYCLNDLHKASGGNPTKKPSEWLRNKQTTELIDELSKVGIPALEEVQPVSVIKGGNAPGTYVCKELVYSYAMWISATFHLKVIRTFDAVVTGQTQTLPAVHDPKTLALIQALFKVDAVEQELARHAEKQEQQAVQIEDVRREVATMKPRLTASSINKIQGAISHAAKWYRQSQSVKHVKLSVNESCIYFQMLLLDKFKVPDINYIDDVAKAYRFLQMEAKKYQTEYNAWLDRNSLFSGGAA